LNYFDVRGTHEASNNDPYSHLQHNHDSLDIRRAHAWSTGDGVDVTIIDTGADFRHPDLKAQIEDRQDFVGFRGGTFDHDAHGTAIAGIIAAEPDNGVGIVGIAPAVRLRILKACWYDASTTAAVCDSFTLAKALAHAIDENTNIINLSLGGPSDALLSRLVSAALARDILVVVADPVQSLAGFPSDVPGVIVAGSVAQPDADRLGAILGAPADEILVPVPGGGFDYASGSSLSAAQVSGVAALLMAKRPGLHRDEIHDLLAGSRNASDANVNACRALSSLLEQSGCGPGESGVSTRAFKKQP
jgi:subtilisin family serine protease